MCMNHEAQGFPCTPCVAHVCLLVHVVLAMSSMKGSSTVDCPLFTPASARVHRRIEDGILAAVVESRVVLQQCSTLLDALETANPEFALLVDYIGRPPVRTHLPASNAFTELVPCTYCLLCYGFCRVVDTMLHLWTLADHTLLLCMHVRAPCSVQPLVSRLPSLQPVKLLLIPSELRCCAGL